MNTIDSKVVYMLIIIICGLLVTIHYVESIITRSTYWVNAELDLAVHAIKEHPQTPTLNQLLRVIKANHTERGFFPRPKTLKQTVMKVQAVLDKHQQAIISEIESLQGVENNQLGEMLKEWFDKLTTNLYAYQHPFKTVMSNTWRS